MERDDVYEAVRPDRIERLARIEGQSNFSSLLAGVEAAADTTEDMAALAFIRHGCIPEVLEAYVAQSTIHRLAICNAVFAAICGELNPKPKELGWIRGAIWDAVERLRTGKQPPRDGRAKQLHVNKDDFEAVRKVAHQILMAELDKAERLWIRARFGRGKNTPRKWHSQGTPRTFSERRAIGTYIQPMLMAGDEISESHNAAIDTHGICMADRLGWDVRNAAPGPVNVYPAQPTAAAHAKADVVTAAP